MDEYTKWKEKIDRAKDIATLEAYQKLIKSSKSLVVDEQYYLDKRIRRRISELKAKS